MYVIFDKDYCEFVAYGETLEQAIAMWEDGGSPINHKCVTVVHGIEKKFKIDLVDANPKAAPKPATKPAVKKTVSKSK